MTLPYVLFVEPQGQTLRSLPSGISKSTDEWQRLYVNTPEAALDIIMQRRISVIVANFASDADSCKNFFQKIPSQENPITPFVLLLEQENDELADCINYAHLCISAQCDAADILREIQRGLSIWEQIKDNIPLAHLLGKLHKLPTPPALYFDLRDELESSNCSTDTVTAIISRDQAITVKLLKVVNSGFYGMPRSIVELKQAISLLGTELVLGLVLTSYLFDSLPIPGLNMDKLWKHNLTVSALAKHIAAKKGGDREIINASGVAGLLHDIGILIFLANLPTQYHTLIREAAGDENILLDLEYQHFSVTHAEVGALALRLCNLPDNIIDAIALHHQYPEQAGLLPAQALSIAEWVVNAYTLHGGDLSENVEQIGMNEERLKLVEGWWQKCAQIAEQIQA